MRGVSLLEMILVLVIMATGAALAIPQLQKGAAQRRADSAIETLRTISHCVRMYKLERGPLTSPKLQDMDDEVHVGGTEGNHCLDPDFFDKNYTWPALTAALGNSLHAYNTKDDRTVCITPLGSTDANDPGYIYDILGSSTSDPCAGGAPASFRTIKE